MEEHTNQVKEVYDVVIIGGGVASLSAAIYSGRKMLRTAVLAAEIGGQTALQPVLDNWPAFLDHDGFELVQRIKAQVVKLPSVSIHEFTHVTSIEKLSSGFSVVTEEGQTFTSRAVIIATGVTPKKLNVPGEAQFEHKGVTYCATCDAPLFGGKDVAVVGGGNAGLEAALQLTEYANRVYLLHLYDVLTGDEITVKKVQSHPKITVLSQSTATKITGETSVTGLAYTNAQGDEQTLTVQGVFVNVGRRPNTDFIGNFLKLNTHGEIIVTKDGETSTPGVYAAGDVTDVIEKQAIIAAGDGARALLAAYRYLTKQTV